MGKGGFLQTNYTGVKGNPKGMWLLLPSATKPNPKLLLTLAAQGGHKLWGERG